MSKVKRYPVEMGWILEPTGEDGFSRMVTEIDGEDVVLATDYDAACRERDEEIARLREQRDYLAQSVAHYEGFFGTKEDDDEHTRQD